MSPENADLIERLRTMATDISGWREQTKVLKAASKEPGAKSDDKLLLTVEETSGTIYDGIAEFDALVADIDKTSHVAAAQIVEVGDALRLQLMEITELGTQLYALRSSPPEPVGRDEAADVADSGSQGPLPDAVK